jgi:hypothetical protein
MFYNARFETTCPEESSYLFELKLTRSTYEVYFSVIYGEKDIIEWENLT